MGYNLVNYENKGHKQIDSMVAFVEVDWTW